MSDIATQGEPDTGAGDAGPDAGAGNGSQGAASAPTIEELQAELDAAQSTARTWEKRAKGNSLAVKELDELKRKGLEPDERALADARAQGASEATLKAGQRLAAAELRAAGIPKGLVEDLNLAKFLDDDGDVDEKAIERFQRKYDESAPTKSRTDLKQGPRSGSAPAADMNTLIRNRRR